MITHKLLLEHLYYDPITGIFIWLKSNNGKIGKQAGSNNGKGYLRIHFFGKHYYATTLAWFYYYKSWPELEVDHKNRIRNDNRIDNLRLATRNEQMLNQKFKYNKFLNGVCFKPDNKSNPYQARITINGKRISLGHYSSAEIAHNKYKEASLKYHNEFSKFKISP